MEGAWTISELAELAGAALADDPVRVNGRVRELPNERLIRWYTTIGLLDPPLARRGRTALYGPRHLLQLVAVKRRQAAGLAIAQIQAELTGATDDMLRDIARLPETGPPDAAAVASVRRPRARERFWAEAPAAGRPPRPQGRPLRAAAIHAATDAAPSATPTTTPPTATPSTTPSTTPTATVVPGIRLAAGVTLVLDGAQRPIGAADLVAIEAAARPLLDELRQRGLHPEQTESSPQPNPESSPESTEPVPPTSPGRRST